MIIIECINCKKSLFPRRHTKRLFREFMDRVFGHIERKHICKKCGGKEFLYKCTTCYEELTIDKTFYQMRGFKK